MLTRDKINDLDRKSLVSGLTQNTVHRDDIVETAWKKWTNAFWRLNLPV